MPRWGMSTRKEALHMDATLTGPVRTIHDVDLAEARAWIADCTWAEDIDTDELTARQVYAGIERHYDGGWPQFIRDAR